MNTYDVIVIGAGPAGLLAAKKAAEGGASVLLLEKMEKPARKLRITGKGRCNITNTKPQEEFFWHIHPNNNFLKPAFKNFSNVQLVSFLNKIGVDTVEERGDRVFPASQKAWDVADALVREAQKNGVTILCHAKVLDLVINQGRCDAVVCDYQGTIQQFAAKAFVVTTGGLSYPATGSTGDGYRWAEDTGHQIVHQRPSLTALEIGQEGRQVVNLDLRNVELSLLIDGGCAQKEFGEMTFTHFGIDGPTVLRISRRAVDALLADKKVAVNVDLKPALSEQQLDNRLKRELQELGSKAKLHQLVAKLLPRQLIDPFIDKTGIAGDKSLLQLKPTELKKVRDLLKLYPLSIVGFRPFKEAIITAGGVALTDIESKTMRSKIIPNLYFAGEVIDLDADTGGYNLQVAFSTGYLAGLQAAKTAQVD